MKTKAWFKLVISFALVGFLALAVGQSGAMAADKAPFKIGLLGGLSGPYAQYGIGTRAGVEVAVEEINKNGGILGRRIELISRDTKFNPENGLSNAKDMVFSEKVDFLIGPTSSGVAKAISGFAKEQKVPLIIPLAQSEHLTGKYGHRYVFRVTTNTHMYAYADAVAAKNLNIKNWWTIAQDYEYGHACYDAFKSISKDLKSDIQIVGEGWPKPGTPDFTPYVTPIVASDAQGLFCAFGGADFTKLLKTGKALGLLKKTTIVGHDLGCLNTYFSLGKGMPEGIWGGTQYPFWDYKTNARSENLYKKVVEKLKRPPGLGAPCGYEAVMAIEAAAKKAGTTDVEKIIDALEGLTLDTVVGPVTIRDFDHQATWPLIYGQTKFVPKYPNFPILVDTFRVGDEGYPTKAAILKARSG